jgi:hypothetical protein
LGASNPGEGSPGEGSPHKLLALSQNALRGRWENFWSSEQTCVVKLVGREAVLDKLVYTATNPVLDHLSSKDLKRLMQPGVVTTPMARHASRGSVRTRPKRPRWIEDSLGDAPRICAMAPGPATVFHSHREINPGRGSAPTAYSGPGVAARLARR